MNLKLFFTIFALLVLTSCTSTIDRLQRVGKNPDLAQLDVPIDENQPSPEEKIAQSRAHMRRTNSLWQPGSTSFFRDNRAWRVGDILTVVVEIKDNANLSNTTQQNRNSSDSVNTNKIFGREKGIAKIMGYTNNAHAFVPNPLQIVDAASSRNQRGQGSIARQENIKTTIAAVVRQVMPNGNLMIEGHQEVRVNSELREVKIAGIIRPRDIKSDNSVSSSQIAEARISYGGRGVVSDMQSPRVASQVLDIVSPF